METPNTNEQNKTEVEPTVVETTTVSESVTTEPTTSNSKTSGGMGIKSIAIVILVACLAIAGLYYYLSPGLGEQMFSDGEPTTIAGLNSQEYPEVVAKVNGKEVTNEDFMQILQQVALSAAQQGADLTDPEVIKQIENEALDISINTTVLTQAAEAEGLSVDPDQITAEVDNVASQFETTEEFTAALAEQNLDEEAFRERVGGQLLIQMYLEAASGDGQLAVSESEVQAVYDQFVAPQEGAPALEEIYGAIEQQLVAEKEAEVVDKVITDLREKAEIEVMLPTQLLQLSQ